MKQFDELKLSHERLQASATLKENQDILIYIKENDKKTEKKINALHKKIDALEIEEIDYLYRQINDLGRVVED
jgi:hypothetical protein